MKVQKNFNKMLKEVTQEKRLKKCGNGTIRQKKMSGKFLKGIAFIFFKN
jgi:hypothetical protein